MRKLLMTGCVLGMVAASIGGEVAFDVDAFLKRIEDMRYTSSLEEVEKLEKDAADNGKAIEEAVAVRLTDKSIKDEDKFKYIGLLSLAKRESSVPMIIDVARVSNPTSMPYQVSLRALATIGGDKAGEFLLGEYRKNGAEMDDEQKFEAMQRLAMMRYAPALKDAEEFLRKDPRYYWQMYFIFGFFDEIAVPMLCERLNDSDGTVRTNALGAIMFLMPDTEALSEAILKRLKVERNQNDRNALIEALEWNMQSRGEKGQQELVKTFNELLKTEDKKSYAAKFMGETVKSGSILLNDTLGKFAPDAVKFEAAYKRISGNGVRFRMDRDGDQDLVYCATREDVPKLLELRRRALYRQSDECFYDHRALTRAIQWVRIAAPKSGK